MPAIYGYCAAVHPGQIFCILPIPALFQATSEYQRVAADPINMHLDAFVKGPKDPSPLREKVTTAAEQCLTAPLPVSDPAKGGEEGLFANSAIVLHSERVDIGIFEY